MSSYHPQSVEKKWQSVWEQEKVYQVDLDQAARPFYNLMMFPYPSAEGLHIGNMYAFVHSDAYGRYIRLQGYDVFEPIGLDGFGIHSENYALKIKEHIRDVSARTEKKFYQQLRAIGNAYDWSRTLETYHPDYYRWTQWLFLKMYEKGLAYRRSSQVNWCPSCQTVLADEQVIDGRCERCESLVEYKEMEQWFWRITDYAEKLYHNLDQIDWSDEVKTAQKNWIGRSEGARIRFSIQAGRQKSAVEVFTTRPDTLFGCTYLVLSSQHKLIEEFKEEIENYDQLVAYLKQITAGSDESREKTGLRLEGLTAVNPVNNQEIPVFVANYILADYGTGAIMAVPAHDQRDWEFAQQNHLEILSVVRPAEGEWPEDQPYLEEGVGVNSDFLDGLPTDSAKEKMINWLEEQGAGQREIAYRLRDWCVSRQRYWGPPIPMIYCEQCGWQPVPEEELPVLLPDIEDFQPDGSGRGPLSKVPDFYQTTCPKCQGPARRETDVSDPFVDSAWYYLRYLCTDFNDRALEPKRMARWLPVDMYIGGREHSVLHLLYVRFVSMVLHELGYVPEEEPFKRFRAHGLLIKDGAKISKSRGNIVNPDKYLAEYGTDAVRLYLMFLGDMRQGGDWRDGGLNGMVRFINRIWSLYQQPRQEASSEEADRMMARAIKKISEDLDQLKFNIAIAQLMTIVNELKGQEKIATKHLEQLAIMLGPFAPHLAEELWQEQLNKKQEPFCSVFAQKWPRYDQSIVKKQQVTLIVQVDGKLRDRLQLPAGLDQAAVEEKARASARTQKFISGQEVVRIAFVPDRLINFVTKS